MRLVHFPTSLAFDRKGCQLLRQAWPSAIMRAVRVLFVLQRVDNEVHGLMHLSSILKNAGHQVKLVVASQQDPVRVAVGFQPGLLGYSVFTGTQNYYLAVNQEIRRRVDAISVFGGPHPTFFPELIERDGVDGVCVGEGEGAILDLVTALEGQGSLVDLLNWHIKVDGVVYRNPVRPLIADLDGIPFADRELLYEAHPPSRETKIKPFITGRGCPFDCSFCFNHAFGELYQGKGKRVRQRSVGNVLAEIKAVRDRYPLEFVTFMDDTFILSRRWLTEFAEAYRRQIGLPFWCQVRANLVDEEIAEILRYAGCVSVSMGVEAGNDHLRNKVLKRNMSKQQMVDASKIIRRAGMKLSTNNMLGLPGGSLAADLETLELNILCRPAYANVFLLQPYPRTELGEEAMRQGLMSGTFEDISASVAEKSVIKFSSEGERRAVENLQKLFAITVELPFLLPLVKQLIKLPRNPFFWLIYKLWKGYALKRRVLPHHLSAREYVRSTVRFLQIRSQ